MPAQTAAGPARVGRIRRWLDRVLRLGIADRVQLPPAGADNQPRQEDTAGSLAGHTATTPSALSFWEELDPAEQAALLSVASLVTFAIGDRLMREGEPADYVIVIIRGQTTVCVDENGWERVIAERGPGQLVGERGGLQVRVRSATVIAVEPVWGLVVTTESFSAFVSAHPRVFDIVENQLYDRLAEDRARYREHSGPGAVSTPSEVRQPAAGRPGDALTAGHPPSGPLSGQNCTILLTDVVAFGSPSRNDEDRRVIREALIGMTHRMLRGTDAWSEDRGDGLLTVVPPDVPTSEVLGRLVKELPLALARHNTSFRDSARFQLRVAINVGPVTTDTMGVSGEAIIIVARLVDAPIFKEAIAKTNANLGIIASPFVYDTVIKHSPDPIDIAGYTQVQVYLKGFATPAWIKLFSTPAPSFYADQSTAPNSVSAYWRATDPLVTEPRH